MTTRSFKLSELTLERRGARLLRPTFAQRRRMRTRQRIEARRTRAAEFASMLARLRASQIEREEHECYRRQSARAFSVRARAWRDVVYELYGVGDVVETIGHDYFIACHGDCEPHGVLSEEERGALMNAIGWRRAYGSFCCESERA